MIDLPKAITFDCYGTLIDWESAIQQFFAESLDAKGVGYVDTRTLQAE
jgi:2-haloacid dehalogenase